jgi:S-formylglutathione hydrolase FrmB
LAVALTLALLVVLGAPPLRPAQAAEHPALADGHGIHVVATTWVSDRLVDVTMTTAALVQGVHVRILVPAGYGTDPGRRYPSTYLLHGCRAGTPNNGLGYQEWTVGMHAESVTANAETIVVMPDGGGGGFYTDWFNGGAGGPPKWETYHISQLLPWVDQNFRTINDRSQRAIAGLSMGGFGALSYASRHPDLFGSVASFSGAADLTNPTEATEAISTVVVDTCAASDGGAPGSTFGSHVDDELNWQAHDPARLVENLRNTQIYLYTGNGQPGPFDPPGKPVDPIEVLAERSTVQFHDLLVAAGVPSFFDDYGAGSHSAPYWERDLRDTLPRFLADFAADRQQPTFLFRSELASYDRFGWHVDIHRDASEFSTLAGAGVNGFTLSGSGSAAVITGPLYEPGASYRVTIRNGGSSSTATLRAGNDGRLEITSILLGQPNRFQELSAAALATGGTRVYTSSVSVVPVAVTTSTTVPAGPTTSATVPVVSSTSSTLSAGPTTATAPPSARPAVAAGPVTGSPAYTG